MKEIWKDIPGYEGLYQASDLGNIRSLDRFSKKGHRLKGKVKKSSLNGRGYLGVTLNNLHYRRTITVHILVAMTFLGHVPCGMKVVVDHKDNNKLNNRKDNLQLTTHRYNTSKDKVGGSSKYVGVDWFSKANKWRALIEIKGKSKHLGLFLNELDAHKAYQKALKDLI